MSKTLKIINPATEEPIEEIAVDEREDVARKYERARAAQPDWADTPLEERLEALQRFDGALDERVDELASMLSGEMGKPVSQAASEIRSTGGRIEFFAEHVEEVSRPQRVLEQGGMVEEIREEPLGVVANISAWNYPYFVGTNVFVPALLTGNAVLYKPSEHTTRTGRAIAEMMHEAGIPEDIFVPVVGAADTGAALVDQAVDGVFFTGSHATGVEIARATAPRLIRTQLELGGKDPIYVCEDVDVEAAASAMADGAFYNTGQSCCAVERLYVHESIYEDFLEAYDEAVGALTVGDPADPETYIGPLARESQLTVLDGQVRDALDRGGRLVRGGRIPERIGHYYEPTIVADAPQDSVLMQEESFGPIIGVRSVSSDAQAIELMDDTKYGLTAGVYTADRDRAESVLSKLEAGSVYWNCCDRVSPRLPWTGRRGSGIGSTLSTYGIRSFLKHKAWHLRSH